MGNSNLKVGLGWALAGVVAVGCSSDGATVDNTAGGSSADPRMVNVGGSLANVDPTVDTDLDGIVDVEEGTGDADMDGIPAHLDADEQGAGVVGTPGATGGESTGATGTAATGTETTGATGVVATGDGGTVPEGCTAGPTVGSSVLVIGDSYMGVSGSPPNKVLAARIQDNARAAGALADGDNYEDLSVPGTSMASGGITDFLLPPIPTQYANANNSDGHIKTVIMTGGGNDVLLGNRSCIDTLAPPESQSCVDTIDNAFGLADTLLAQMATDGVENVIYFFYPHLPGGGLGGDKQLSNDTIDYALEGRGDDSLPQLCADAPVSCHFLDTRGLFPDEEVEFQDGIHPIDTNTHKMIRVDTLLRGVWRRTLS
jgi:hypothetical protein